MAVGKYITWDSNNSNSVDVTSGPSGPSGIGSNYAEFETHFEVAVSAPTILTYYHEHYYNGVKTSSGYSISFTRNSDYGQNNGSGKFWFSYDVKIRSNMLGYHRIEFYYQNANGTSRTFISSYEFEIYIKDTIRYEIVSPDVIRIDSGSTVTVTTVCNGYLTRVLNDICNVDLSLPSCLVYNNDNTSDNTHKLLAQNYTGSTISTILSTANSSYPTLPSDLAQYYQVYATYHDEISVFVTSSLLTSVITQSNITKTYGNAAFTITPSRTGVSSLRWSLSTTGVVSLSATTGNSVTATIQGAGTVTVTLSGTAASGYNAPANKTFTITVNKATPTISVSPATQNVYGYLGTNATATATTSPSSLTINYTGATGGTVSISSKTITFTRPSSPGTVSANFYAVGNSNYYNSSNYAASASFIKATPTITCSTTAMTFTYGGSAQTRTATKSHTQCNAITVSSSNTNVATVSISGSTVTVTPKNGGSCTIRLNIASSTWFNAASQVSFSVTVNKASSSLSVTSNGKQVYGYIGAGSLNISATPAAVITSPYFITLSSTYSANYSNPSNYSLSYSRIPTPNGENYNVLSITAGSTPGKYGVSISGTANYTDSNGTYANPNYSNPSSVEAYIDFIKATPTITCSTTTMTFTYGGAAQTRTATKSHTQCNNITVSSSNTSVATVSISGSTVTVTPKNGGSCTIYLNIASSTWFNAASQVSFSVKVNKASSSISVSPSTQNVYGYLGTNATATASTTPSSLSVSYIGASGGDITVSGKTITFVRPSTPGTVAANFYAVSDNNYDSSAYYNAYASFIKATPTITCSVTQVTFTYGDSPRQQTVSLTKSHTQCNSISANLSTGGLGNTVAGISLSNNNLYVDSYNAGTTWAYLNIASSTWFNAATQKAVKIVVNQKKIVTNQGSNESIYYGTTINHTISRTPSVGSVGYLESSNTDVATVTATSATNLSIVAGYLGTTTIFVAHYAPNGNYINADTKTFTVTVVQAPWPTITISPSSKTVTYGDANFTISVSGYPVGTTFLWTSNNTSAASIYSGSTSATVTIDPNNAGSATITCTLTNSNYQGNSITKTCTVTVNKASWPAVTISPSSKTVTYGDGNFTISVSGYPSGSTFSWSSSNSNSAAIYSGSTSATVTIDPNNVGSATITCTISNSNYSGTVSKTCTVTVNKATPTISVSPASQSVYGYLGTNATATATTVPSSLTVNYTEAAGGDITLSGKKITFVRPSEPGTVSANFYAEGNDNYNDSSTYAASASFVKATPTITCSTTAMTFTYGGVAQTCTATKSHTGCNVITVSSTDPNVATVSISETTVTVTPKNAGTCTIRLNIAASTWFNAAAQVSFSVTVNKASWPTISISPSSKSVTYGDANFNIGVSNYPTGSTFSWSTTNANSASIHSGSTSATATIDPNNVGSATITCTISNSNYSGTVSKTCNVTVNKKSTTVATNISNQTFTYYDTTTFSLTPNKSEGISAITHSIANNTSNITGEKTISDGEQADGTFTFDILNSGTAQITFSGTASNNNYSGSSKTITITVNKKQISVNAGADVTKTYGDAAFNQTVSHSPIVTTLSSVTSSNADCATVAKENDTTIKITPVNANWGASSSTITVNFNAPDNNYLSGSDTMVITVNRKNGTLTLTSPNVNHYGYLGDYINSYTTVPNSNGVTSNNENVTVSNGKYTVKRPASPGTVTATLTSVATKNYNASTATLSVKFITAPVTLTASPASITTTYVANGKNHTVTISRSPSGAPDVSATSSNNETVATSSNNSNTVTITTKNAGSANITVSTEANTWYDEASTNIPVTVNKFQDVITNPGNKTFTYSDALTVNITSGKTAGVGDLTWTIEKQNGCVSLNSSSGNTATFNIDSVGTTKVTISAPSTDEDNYIKPVDQTFNITINKGNTVTTLNSTSNILWIAPETGKSYLTSFNAAATMASIPTDRSMGTDDYNHYWESSNTNIATVSSSSGSGVTITPINPGTCTIYSYYLGSTVFNPSDKKSISITVYKRNPYTLSLTWNNNIVNNKWINTDNDNDIVIYAEPSILLDTIGKTLSGKSSATNIVSNVTENNTDSNTKANYTCEIDGTLGTSKITIETEDAWNGNNFYPKTSAITNISRITFEEPSTSNSIKIANNNYLNTHYGVKTDNDLTLCPTASSIENLSLIKIMNREEISDNQLVPESYIFKQITSSDYYKSTDYCPPHN